MIQPGQPAPDFCLPDSDGVNVSLGELLAAGPVLLYFYPADFTPGCTAEACSFRDMQSDLTAVGVQVVGISPQDAVTHREFRRQYRLPFRLLADPAKQVIALYDAVGPFGLGIKRISYLIGTDGLVQDALQADMRIGRHRDFAARQVAKAQGENP